MKADYIKRMTTQGMSKQEAERCWKHILRTEAKKITDQIRGK